MSYWIHELIITGDVKLGKEKSQQEIDEQLKARLENAEQAVVSLTDQNVYLQKKYVVS